MQWSHWPPSRGSIRCRCESPECLADAPKINLNLTVLWFESQILAQNLTWTPPRRITTADVKLSCYVTHSQEADDVELLVESVAFTHAERVCVFVSDIAALARFDYRFMLGWQTYIIRYYVMGLGDRLVGVSLCVFLSFYINCVSYKLASALFPGHFLCFSHCMETIMTSQIPAGAVLSYKCPLTTLSAKLYSFPLISLI